MNSALSLLEFTSLHQFRAVYEPVSDLVFLIDLHNHAIVAANPAFSQLIGENGGLPGLNADSLIPADVFRQLPLLDVHTLSMCRPGSDPFEVVLQLLPARIGEELYYLCIARESERAELEDLIAAAEKEKRALLSEVYHRVKNNLNIILSLLSLQLNRVQEPNARHLLLESKSRIYTLALLQERLYASPRLSEIRANDYLVKLMQAVLASFRMPGQEIALQHQINAAWMNVDQLLPLGLIVHELLANAVQHAFSARTDGRIEVTLAEPSSGRCRLTVRDNGSGLADPTLYATPKSGSLGAQLVLNLVRQLKGELQLTSTSAAGTTVLVEFPFIPEHAA
ncbi:sensor histidine kinase [Cesiribacter andamanensis]|uniref:histidine kinase n=1 Tax=Cesiribacter andamanensis AMV16 TaxID=1279009 RepID=M7N9T7_9BACT|nr:histidine kinase dimerization/phosphoacceptor domain -containing protein [Cesiribacter andamanensis]EMR03971.1 putative sensor histidine kinase pdtaS [Cesiribacter andamanensis AMV16]